MRDDDEDSFGTIDGSANSKGNFGGGSKTKPQHQRVSSHILMNDISKFYQNEPKSSLLRKPSIKKSKYMGRSGMKKDERKGLNISVLELDKTGNEDSESNNFNSVKSEVSGSDSSEDQSDTDDCGNQLESINDCSVHRILSMRPK